MHEFLVNLLTNQYQAALAMLDQCVRKCPAKHWDGKIANYTFWQVAYHTLCFTDLYLTANEKSFQFREIHPQGWSEFNDEYPSRRFEQSELIEYVTVCRAKMMESLAVETRETLEDESGHPRLLFSRGELHVSNIRHLQHHIGQLSAYLRRNGCDIDWVKTGWR